MNPEVQVIKGKKKPALVLNRAISCEKQRGALILTAFILKP